MTEAQVISKTLVHLIKEENFTVESVSIRTKTETDELKKLLVNEEVSEEVIQKIVVSRDGVDVNGYFAFNQLRPQKRLFIEAKGGDVYYNFYTMLGQFITMKTSPSSYYWFAFALPKTWKQKVKNYFTYSDSKEVKPIIQDIIDKYTKNGQGLYFYFASENNVERITWKTLIN